MLSRGARGRPSRRSPPRPARRGRTGTSRRPGHFPARSGRDGAVPLTPPCGYYAVPFLACCRVASVAGCCADRRRGRLEGGRSPDRPTAALASVPLGPLAPRRPGTHARHDKEGRLGPPQAAGRLPKAAFPWAACARPLPRFTGGRARDSRTFPPRPPDSRYLSTMGHVVKAAEAAKGRGSGRNGRPGEGRWSWQCRWEVAPLVCGQGRGRENGVFSCGRFVRKVLSG
jgi:hypothetical protein